jgi:predicted nucleic acid-binding protein
VAFAFPPASEICFLDANILYYHVIAQEGLSDYCTALIREIVLGQRKAATTATAMSDAVHKVMFTEAATFYKRPRAGLLAWIKDDPGAIKQLSVFRAAAERFAELPLWMLQVNEDSVKMAADISAATGLLSGDALNLAAMEENDIRHLVTNDDDYDGIAGVTVWKPR